MLLGTGGHSRGWGGHLFLIWASLFLLIGCLIFSFPNHALAGSDSFQKSHMSFYSVLAWMPLGGGVGRVRSRCGGGDLLVGAGLTVASSPSGLGEGGLECLQRLWR